MITPSRRSPFALALAIACLAIQFSASSSVAEPGKPAIQSMSVLTFAPDGTLLVGDGKAGAVFAIDLGEQQPSTVPEQLQIQAIGAKIGAMLGTTADEVMIHDLAVHPQSHGIFLAVSRGGTGWESRWQLPNHIGDANVLLRVTAEGQIEQVKLDAVEFTQVELPNPISAEKQHRWLEISQRTDTITDLAVADDTLYIAGLSNEEFASTLWKVPYPFSGTPEPTTLEIYHGAHGASETHAPIRTFVPFDLAGKAHLLAAYLCTPLVTFDVAAIADAEHLKGRTVAEFGAGNYPLDMVVYEKEGKEKLLIANSNLPLMIVDPADIESYEGEIAEELDTYVAGVPYEARAGTGIQQLALLDEDNFVALQRLPGGTLEMVSLAVRRY